MSRDIFNIDIKSDEPLLLKQGDESVIFVNLDQFDSLNRRGELNYASAFVARAEEQSDIDFITTPNEGREILHLQHQRYEDPSNFPAEFVLLSGPVEAIFIRPERLDFDYLYSVFVAPPDESSQLYTTMRDAFGEQGQDIIAYWFAQHELAHALDNFGEAGSDYMATARTLMKYPEARQTLEVMADMRLHQTLIQPSVNSLKTDRYGHECAFGMKAALSLSDEEIGTFEKKGLIPDSVLRGVANDFDQMAYDNSVLEFRDQPEMKVRDYIHHTESDYTNSNDVASPLALIIDKNHEGLIEHVRSLKNSDTFPFEEGTQEAFIFDAFEKALSKGLEHGYTPETKRDGPVDPSLMPGYRH